MTARAKTTEAAERLVKAGKFADAIAEYQKLLDGSPQDIPVTNTIGDLFVQLGQRDKARKSFLTSLAQLEKRGAFAQALAIARKVLKLDPSDAEIMVRLGDLYGRMGFLSEARNEYLKAAQERESRNDVSGEIAILEKLTRLDRTDVTSRLTLARLFVGKGEAKQATAELNDIADILFVREQFDDAEKILIEALELRDGDVRTVSDLVRIYLRRGNRSEAVALVEQSLRKHNRPEFLLLLGTLHLEGQDLGRAYDVLSRLLAGDPDHVEARIKLAQVEILNGQPDRAFELLEPLVSNLMNKGQIEKAVGLLGLIVMSGSLHVPSLEKLAAIYRLDDRRANLEVVDRLLLDEYRRAGEEEKRAKVLWELTELCPKDPDLAEEMKGLTTDTQVPPEEQFPAGPRALTQSDRELINVNLAKADLYVKQRLVRNARRILENLSVLYPDEARIELQLQLLSTQSVFVDQEDIPDMVEKIGPREAEIESRGASPTVPPPDTAPELPQPKDLPREPERKIGLAEIFEDLDLVPDDARRDAPAPAAYPDLTDKIREELDAMEIAFFSQLKDKVSVIEKDLADIVADFRREIVTRIERDNPEARYNLGLAFMEQGLTDEAIEEFRIAAGSEAWAVDSLSLAAQCFRQKRNFAEARLWLEKALRLAPEGSHPHFALLYDLATLAEDMKDNAAALALYRRVRDWDAGYRETARRIKILEKLSASSSA